MRVLDAVEGDAEPSEQSIVLADMRRQLAVDGLDLHQLEMLGLQLAPHLLRAVVEAQHAIVIVVRLPETGNRSLVSRSISRA